MKVCSLCNSGTLTILINLLLEPLPFDDSQQSDTSSSRHTSPTILEDILNRVRFFESRKREQDEWREVLAQDAQTTLTSQRPPTSPQAARLSRSTSLSSSRKAHGPHENAEPRRTTPQVRGPPINAVNLQQRYENRDNFDLVQTFRNIWVPNRGNNQQTPQKLNLRDIRDRIFRQIDEFDHEMEADTRRFNQVPRLNPTPAPIHSPVTPQRPPDPPRTASTTSERLGPKPLPHQRAVR